MRNLYKTIINFTLALLLLTFVSCSTPPKKQTDTYKLRKQAENLLDLGNRQADRGDFDAALTTLGEAQRLAIITDDYRIKVRSSLSLGNALFTVGRSEDAANEWETALTEARAEGNNELAAVCRVYLARYRLLSDLATAQTVRDGVKQDMNEIKTDKLYIAFAWLVIGLAEKELGRYAEAEAALKNSLAIHEKERYLELAAYDWYLIASCRSLGKDYDGARLALTEAITLDRRMENSWGLAADWRAMGDVYKRAGKSTDAKAAYLRSAQIFRSLKNEKEAENVESRIDLPTEQSAITEQSSITEQSPITEQSLTTEQSPD